MAVNTQQDSVFYDKLYFPYNRILSPHDDTSRIIEGLNTYITTGGKLSRRPATITIPGGAELGRIDRLFLYETLNGKIYLLASIYDYIGEKWTMFYNRLSASTNWVQIGTIRSCDASTAPQEVVCARGLAFIRNTPVSAASDPYGTAVFDGSGTPTLSPWGIAPPSTPVAIRGAISHLSADITAAVTTIILDANFSPAPSTPFTAIIENEEIYVTANASGTLTVTRGYNGTTASSHLAKTPVIYRNFGASSHRVDVNRGWEYSYAYVSRTGQISNLAPPQTNPDKMPSNTGVFIDLIPAITIPGYDDPVIYPHINVYRTTDGFGQYYFLERITNPGDGVNVTYLDDSLGSGAAGTTYNDPVPDAILSTNNIGPTLTSNSPPPAVVSPQITGIDNPLQGTPLAYFAGRIWYGLKNYIFYSGNEEIMEGVPEECFPSGLFGNYFKFQHEIINMRSTVNALYVTTVHDTYVITGSVRAEFAVRPLYKNMGSPNGQPLSMTTFGDKVAILTNDYRVAILEGDREPHIISDPLYTDIVNTITVQAAKCEITYFGDLDKEWLIVTIHNVNNAALSRQFVYDIKLSKKLERDFWFTPWSIPSVCMFSGRIYEDSSQRRLCFFVFDNTTTYGILTYLDTTATANTDTISSNFQSVQSGIDFHATFNQHLNPAGNHVNLLRVPNLTPVVNQLTLERILYNGDSDPDVFYYLDDIWTDPISVEVLNDPARRNLPIGYKTHIATFNEACFRFSFQIRINSSIRPFDLLGYTITWNPDAGA